MRSYASAYKICGEVSPAESQRDGPIALCALPDYRNQRYRTRSGSASGDGVSSYDFSSNLEKQHDMGGPLVPAALVGCCVTTWVNDAVFDVTKVEPGATVAVIGCVGQGYQRAVNTVGAQMQGDLQSAT